jgi:hypothetical protein
LDIFIRTISKNLCSNRGQIPMPATLNQPDGLYLIAQATLLQLHNDEALTHFADGLLASTLTYTIHSLRAPASRTFNSSLTLAEALHYLGGCETYPLLTALLALDAEVYATIDDEPRVLPLPGFLSYRPSLPPNRVPLDSVRLPPLNPGGRYRFTVVDNGAFLVVRLDLHPGLNLAGHVRLAVSSPTRSPVRLLAAEHRLDRQVLTEQLIETAIEVGSQDLPVPLRQGEWVGLVETLKKLMSEKTTADG